MFEMITSESLSIVSSILLAFFTLLLAYFTWKLAKTSNLQAEFIKKQSDIQTKQLNPFLQIKNIKFIKNRIKFTIKNIGQGDAYSLGVYSNFSISKMEIEKIFKKNKKLQALAKWNYEPKTLIDFKEENKKIISNGNVTFLKRDDYQNIILKPSEEIHFDVEPNYWISYYPENKIVFGKTHGRQINITDLMEIFKKNDILFINIEFSIVYKNALREIVEHLPLANFIFDIKNHKTLQDAIKTNYKPSLIQLSYTEIESKVGNVPYYIYKILR